ncbi:MAG TPA: alpha/beta hydrolase [Streptosporangiaceae bacterium]|jgi:pimeloyl-ACP methyl ester carboxylesterase
MVLIGGATDDLRMWDSVTPMLAGHMALHALDRRGRGASGDRPGSAVADEIADVRAVVGAVGGGAWLVGHSSGALLALRAAAPSDFAAGSIRGVIAYEPPPPPPRGKHVADRVAALAAAGDRDGALAAFMTDCAGLPMPAVAQRRGTPEWQAALRLAHTLAYDAAIAAEGVPDAESLTTPICLLLGGASPAPMSGNVRQIAARLPSATVRVLDGQRHDAITSAPHLFAEHVLAAIETRRWA